MNSAFSEQILADKLAKLNSTQQCIETLSHWCIFHRKKAEDVVQTWDKAFHSSQKEQKIPLLYLANDILQNSKKNGTEFVEEFWKVLPAALKDVSENGDDRGKKVVSRLVGIWEERRVFGSRAQGLKDLMLGNEPPPALELNKKRSRSVRVLKRDSRSIKIKLTIGGAAEKIVSALQTVMSDRISEGEDLNKCKAAVCRVENMEKDVASACIQDGDPLRVTLANELQEEEAVLKKCIENLKSVESNRAALVSQLKETLQEQESELENIRTQLQVAQARAGEAENMRRRLNNEPVVASSNGSLATNKPKKSAAAIAAELADKLTASTHSQQIMTSVLSTFAAEEAKNAGLKSSANLSVPFSETPLGGLKLEKPSVVQAAAFVPLQQQQTVLVQQAPIHQNQPSTAPPQYMYSAPPQQYLQSSSSVMMAVPYTYSTLPPPPTPLPPQPQMMNMGRPSLPLAQQQPMAMVQQPVPPPPPMTLHQSMTLNQQPPAPTARQQPVPPNYRPLQPPSMAFYHQQA